MPTIQEGEYAFYMSDLKWFAEQRAHMKWAFDPVSPALQTMFWANHETHQRICHHVWQTSEDSRTCVKCGKVDEPEFLNPTPAELAWMLKCERQHYGDGYDEGTNPSNGWRHPLD